jgi:O-antigen/teichoic acid export membrane protein
MPRNVTIENSNTHLAVACSNCTGTKADIDAKPDARLGLLAAGSTVRNVLSNCIGLFASALVSFLLTPILIKGLGDFHYGMWILVASAVDYYGLLDLGMRWTLFRYAARFKGAKERAALSESFVTALAITVIIGAVVALLTIPFLVVLPAFFKLTGPSVIVFRSLLLLLGLSVAVAFPAQLLGSYLCALRRFDLYNVAMVGTCLVRAVLVIAVLHLGFGVLAVGGVTLGVGLLSLFLNGALVRAADPQAPLRLKQANWRRASELIVFSFYAFLSMVGDHLRFYTDSVVIGRMLGLALVTPFSVATRLMFMFRQILIAVASPFSGVMSELDGQGRDEELRKYFLRATRLTAILSFFLASLLVLEGKPLIHFWVGDRLLSSYRLLLILLAGYVITLAQQPSADVVIAKARHQLRGWTTLLEGSGNLILSIYWARSYGLTGVALGTAVPMLIVQIFVQPWYALWVLRLSPWRYLKEALARPMVVCILFIGVGLLTRPAIQETVGVFLLNGLWQFAIYALLTYTVALTAQERRIIFSGGQNLAALVRLRRNV